MSNYGETFDPQANPRQSPDGQSPRIPSKVSVETKRNMDSEKRKSVDDVQEVRNGEKAVFNNCGVTVACSHLKDDVFKLSCSAVPLEDSDSDFKIADTEDILSDVIAFRVESASPKKMKAKVTFPLFSAPEDSEELVVKTDTGQQLKVSKTKRKKKIWNCTVRGDLRTFSSLVALCRPKKETFVVSPEAAVLKSKTFDGLEFHISADTFSGPSKATLEVLDINKATVREDMKGVLSSTPFCRLDVGVGVLSRPIDYHLPLPKDYSKSGQLVGFTLSHSVASDLQVITVTPDVHRDYLKMHSDCSVWNICLEVAPNCCNEKGLGILKTQVLELYQKCKRREFLVCFMVFSKQLEDPSGIYVVAECCLERDMKYVRRQWMKDGFKEHSATVKSLVPNQSFKITCDNSFKIVDERRLSLLTFHPRRHNVCRFNLEILKNVNFKADSGYLHITRVPDTSETGSPMSIRVPLDSPLVHPQENSARVIEVLSSEQSPDKDPQRTNSQTGGGLVKVKHMTPVQMPKPAISEIPVVDTGTPQTFAGSDMTGTSINRYDSMTSVEQAPFISKQENVVSRGMALLKKRHVDIKDEYFRDTFMDDWFIETVYGLLGREWCAVLCLLGVPFTTIEKAMTPNREVGETVHMLLRSWRDDNAAYDDQGLPALLSATRKAGRRDISTHTLVELKNWNDANCERQNGFRNWLKKAYTDHNILVPPDYPEPMTDQYLAFIGAQLAPSPSLADLLSCPVPAYNAIAAGKNMYAFDQAKVMKLLTTYRLLVPDRIQALSGMLQIFDSLGDKETKSKMLSCARGWYSRTTVMDNPFRLNVRIFLDDYGPPIEKRTVSARPVAYREFSRIVKRRSSTTARQLYGRRMSRRSSTINRSLLVI